MNASELFDNLLDMLIKEKPDFELGEFHKAVLFDCCERSVNCYLEGRVKVELTLLLALQTFNLSLSLIGGVVKGVIPEFSDSVTIYFQGKNFVVPKNPN